VRDDADRADEAESLRLVVEVAEERAAADACDAALRIDAHAAHARKVDHDPVVTGREARNAVPAAAHRDRKLLRSREADGRDDVGGTRRADDHRRAAVDHPVPDRARRLVRRILREDHLTRESGGESPPCCFLNRHLYIMRRQRNRR
jgi:hypothetical protein